MYKKVLAICIVMCTLFLRAQSPLAFTIYTISSTGSITCSNQSVNFVARADQNNNASFSWISPLASYFGSSVSISVPGTYTVTAAAPTAQNSSTLLTVGVDTTTPISSLSSLSQVISCSSSTIGQFNAFGNLIVNASHNFISPYGGTVVINGPSASYKPAAPGTYTHVLINTETGCTTTKTFTLAYSGITSNSPTFDLSSPQNYTYGCGSNSFVSIHINNGNTSPASGGPVSYTLIGPQTSTFVPTSGPLGVATIYTLSAPGEYTVVVRDNTSNCESRSAFSIIQNTAGPDLIVIVPKQILNCTTPSVQLEAVSMAHNISYNWGYIGSPGSLPGDTISINTNSSLPTTTLINTYTLTATNDGNLCATSTVIPIYQNLFSPILTIAAPYTVLTCYSPTVLLTNQSSTGIPPSTFAANLPVTAAWYGPQSTSLSSFYIVSNSGIYSVTVTDQNNGCTKSNTNIPIFDGKFYPMVNNPSGPVPFCINSSVTTVPIYALVSGTAGRYSYLWAGPSSTAIVGSTLTETLQANAIGIYTVIVTNTLSGCSTMGQVIVKNCITGISENRGSSPELSLYPNPSNGLLTIECNTIQNNTSVKIVTVLGSLVEEQTLGSGKNTVDLSARPNGIYFVFILENNIPVHSVKVIKN